MFEKILIANRGEIACRVMRTARRMGIRSVAVYSTADRDAPHVALADEAICVGPPPAAESYLNIDRIVAACQKAGAEAVHPGYGFLSENAEFASRLASAGVTFIGPSPQAMARLGDKIAARRLARQVGVPLVPGREEALASAAAAIAAADEIGYPVILKASAGGGGKGMRAVWNDAECRAGFARAASEAKAAFGDGRVFLEKLITRPRHVEIQVLGDQHGRMIHLGERDCSLQRRHQKVIEESPAPHLFKATRALMCGHAVALAKAAGYYSAGTVEFLVDERGEHYFLEMNTRLQVEHPVTEAVTGLDLVEQMIRIAAGEKLALEQDAVRQDGWAIEARVYAEDPRRGFLPSAGRLTRYRPPPETAGLRVDGGVIEGGEVSTHYDPLLTKVIAHGQTRDEAIERLLGGLDKFLLRGVGNNLSFLASLLSSDAFRDGRLSTQLIAETFPEGFQPSAFDRATRAIFVLASATMHGIESARAAQISGQLPGYPATLAENWSAIIGGEFHDVRIKPKGGGWDVAFEDQRVEVSTDWKPGDALLEFRVHIPGVAPKQIGMQVERAGLMRRLRYRGAETESLVLTPRAAELLAKTPPKSTTAGARQVHSPMPGLLAQLHAAAGDSVVLGQPLAIIEAMKMENVLLAERAGIIAAVFVRTGETLAAGQAMFEFAEDHPARTGMDGESV